MGKILIKNECYKDKTILNSVNLNNVEFSGKDMNRTFKNCTNLKKVINIDSKITTLNETFSGCTKLKEDLRIDAKDITSCEGAFTGNTYAKKVYIHYYNSNNTPTTTYTTFINAGYDEVGSKDCVFLDNIDNPNDLTIYRFNNPDEYISNYGFFTDDGTPTLSLSTSYNDLFKPSKISFYNRNGTVIDEFYMPNRGSIDGLNYTDWIALLGNVGLDMPRYGENYSSFNKCRFFKYNDKYWAYYANLPFTVWYAFIKNSTIYCFPNSPWQEDRITLKTYKQIDLNAFTSGTNAADTGYCYPIYYSHTNNIIYAMYMTSSGGANSKYIINLDNNYNITSKTSGFTVNGDTFKVAWYSDISYVARELNSDFTVGNLQLTKLTNSSGKKQWFAISETSNGVLDCNTTRNTNLNNYISTVFGNPTLSSTPEIYALPGNFFLVFSTHRTKGPSIYKFHFNGNNIVDDGLYLTIPTGYIAPSNGKRTFLNYFSKEFGWSFYKNDKDEFIIIARRFATTADLPNFLSKTSATITLDDSKYNSYQDPNDIVHFSYKGTEQNVVLMNPEVPLEVKLQFRDAYTHELIEDIYGNADGESVIPLINFEGAIATRNMYEYLVPCAGTYGIRFISSQRLDKYQPAPYQEYEIYEHNQVITIDLVPTPDLPDTKFTGTLQSWYGENEPYYNYLHINSRSWLLGIFDIDNNTYAAPLTNNFTISQEGILNTQWDTDLSPDSSSSWLIDYAYFIYCYGDGYYISKASPILGDHVYTFSINNGTLTKTNIADISLAQTSEAGKAYLDSENKLHINGLGVFTYNENKSGLIVRE